MATTFRKKVPVTSNNTTFTSTNTDCSTSNFLAIGISVFASNSVTSVSDSSGNTWTAHSSNPQTVNGACTGYVYYCVNPTVTSTQTFTVQVNSSDVYYFEIIGNSGRATSTAVEGLNFNKDGSSGTSHTGGATGTITAGDDVIAYLFDDNAAISGLNMTWTQGTGWTLAAGDYSGDGRFTTTGGFEYIDNVGSTSSQTATWTTSSSSLGGAFVLAIKASGGGGGSQTITASTGTFTYTPQSAPLGLAIVEAFGSFSLAGQAVTLTQTGGDQTILAATGAFSVNGGLTTTDSSLLASNGSYSLIGNLATLSTTGSFASGGIADHPIGMPIRLGGFRV